MTGLREKCILEIDVQDEDGQIRTAAFQIQEDLNTVGEINRQYLVSERGQYIREIYDIGTDLLPDDVADADLEDRKGYHLDGGAGSYRQTITGTVATDEAPWGDGSAPAGEYTTYDASGDAPLVVKKQVLEWALAQTQSDSRGNTRLYIGEFADGTYSDGGDAGVFGHPLTVAIPEVSITNDPDDPSGLEVMLECTWTALFPDVDVGDAIETGAEAIAELVPDYG